METLSARLKGQAVSREPLNLPHEGRVTAIGVYGKITLVTRVALRMEIRETGGPAGRWLGPSPSESRVHTGSKRGWVSEVKCARREGQDPTAAYGEDRRVGLSKEAEEYESKGSWPAEEMAAVAVSVAEAVESGAEEFRKRLRLLTDLMWEAVLHFSVDHERRRWETAMMVFFGRL